MASATLQGVAKLSGSFSVGGLLARELHVADWEEGSPSLFGILLPTKAHALSLSWRPALNPPAPRTRPFFALDETGRATKVRVILVLHPQFCHEGHAYTDDDLKCSRIYMIKSAAHRRQCCRSIHQNCGCVAFHPNLALLVSQLLLQEGKTLRIFGIKSVSNSCL